MRQSITNHVYLGLRWPKNKHWLASCMYVRAVGNRGPGSEGSFPPYPQVLTDQLNSIPTGGGGDYEHLITCLPAPLNFQTFLRPCMRGAPTILIICIHSIIRTWWKPILKAQLFWSKAIMRYTVDSKSQNEILVSSNLPKSEPLKWVKSKKQRLIIELISPI